MKTFHVPLTLEISLSFLFADRYAETKKGKFDLVIFNVDCCPFGNPVFHPLNEITSTISMYFLIIKQSPENKKIGFKYWKKSKTDFKMSVTVH